MLSRLIHYFLWPGCSGVGGAASRDRAEKLKPMIIAIPREFHLFAAS